MPLTRGGVERDGDRRRRARARGSCDSVADALRSVPGLTLVAHRRPAARRPALFPRGGESNYTLVSIDGVPANAFGGGFDFGAPVDGEHRPDRGRARAAERALRRRTRSAAWCRIITRRGGPPSAAAPGRGRQLRHVPRDRLDRRQLRRRWTWGGVLRQLLSRRHERRAHGRRRDRRATTTTRDDRSRHRSAGAAATAWRARRRAARPSTSAAFPGPFGSNPIGTYGGIDRRVARRTIRERRSARRAGRRCSPRASGCRHRRTTTSIDRRLRRASSTSPQSYSRRGTGRVQADVAVAPGIRTSRPAWSSSVSARAAPSSPATAAQEIPVDAASSGYFVEGRWTSQRTAVRDGGAARRASSGATPRGVHDSFSSAAAAAEPTRSSRSTRGSPGPGWLAPRRRRLHTHSRRPSAPASGRPTASSSPSPTTRA